MKRLKYLSYPFIFAFSLSVSLQTYALDENEKNECPLDALDSSSEAPVNPHAHPLNPPTGETLVRFSERQSKEEKAELQQAIDLVYKKGGIADNVGLALPPHTAEVMPSVDLLMLASMGRHAVPHWHEGATILDALKGPSGILEFVTPGCPTCRSFYRDTTSHVEQISVLLHVVGHNHFAHHSIFEIGRHTDPITSSIDLGDLMRQLYQQYDHDEVSQFYQYLLTTTYLQDFGFGTFDSIESLVTKISPPEKLRPIRQTTKDEYKLANNITEIRTRSALQGLAATVINNGTLPEWKKKMAHTFEAMNRVLPAYGQTKIMNEGWATMMQVILANHSPWNDSKHALEFTQLLAGVKPPNLSNPYWLGFEGWNRLRIKFNARPEISKLSPLEQDRLFVKEMTTKYIRTYCDYDWLQEALDEQWVADHGLYLYRKAKNHEYDYSLPREKPTDEEQFIIVSRDAKRVSKKIADLLSDRRLSIPQIEFRGLEKSMGTAVHFNHENVEDIPLQRQMMGPALYVMSQVTEMPILLETIGSSAWIKKPNSPRFGPFLPPWMSYNEQAAPQAESAPTSWPIRVRVFPNGKAEVAHGPTHTATDEQEIARAELETLLNEAISAYQENMEVGQSDGFASFEREKFHAIGKESLNFALETPAAIVNHAHTATESMHEYAQKLKERLLKMLRLAAKGKLPVRKVGGSRVAIQALPPIPHLEYDGKIKKQILDIKENNEPVDMLPALRISSTLVGKYSESMSATVGSDRRRRTGDKFWGPKPKNGDGEGEEGEEGEEGQDPNHGPGPGRDPSEVEVPLALYGQLLAEELKLPNIRRTDGESNEVDFVREGSVNRSFGNILWEKTVNKAIPYGMAAAKKIKNETGKTLSKFEVLRRGMRMLLPSDYVVSDRSEVPVPSVKAVVVFNIDLTGSMQGRPQALAKEIVFNMKALIQAYYQDVDFVFIGFDDKAYQMTEKKIFRTFLGGGNKESAALQKTYEILESGKYPTANYNKYVVMIGDAGTYDTEDSEKWFNKLYPSTQYMGFMHVPQFGGSSMYTGPFTDMLENLHKKLPWFSYAQVQDSTGEVIQGIKTFFNKDGAK